MKHPLQGVIALLFSVFVLFQACESQNEPESTFSIIQSQILQPSCAQSCHTAGTTFAQQSGLILDASVSYSNLVNKTPTNSAAAADGLKLISTAGVSGPANSFLWQKIDPVHDHAGDHPEYGQLMPLGGDPLTNGQLEFIRQWIVAGAPESGEVADRALLKDTTVYRQSGTFIPLTPPARGVQIKLGPFAVPPKFEREFNYFQPNASADTQYIKRVEISMRPGSHHFILYTFPPGTPSHVLPQPHTFRDIRNTDGTLNITNLLQMSYHEFFSGTQWQVMDDELPEGVALEWPAGLGVDLNSHYVNRNTIASIGEVHINLHTVPKSEVLHVAKILNIGNQSFNLPAGQTTTIRYTKTATQKMNIIKMFTHAHQLMTKFDIQVVGGTRNGEIVYSTTDWEHPPILTLNPPLVLNAGEGLRLIATYNNWRTKPVSFGLTSEDEMMILFGYWY